MNKLHIYCIIAVILLFLPLHSMGYSIGIDKIETNEQIYSGIENIELSENETILDIYPIVDGLMEYQNHPIAGQLNVIFDGTIYDGWIYNEYEKIVIDTENKTGILSVIYIFNDKNTTRIVSDSVRITRGSYAGEVNNLNFSMVTTYSNYEEPANHSGRWILENTRSPKINKVDEIIDVDIVRGHYGLLNETWNNAVNSSLLIQDAMGLRVFNGSIYSDSITNIHFISTISQGMVIRDNSSATDQFLDQHVNNTSNGVSLFDLTKLDLSLNISHHSSTQTELQEYRTNVPFSTIFIGLIVITGYRSKESKQ